MKKFLIPLAALCGFFIAQNSYATCSNYKTFTDGSVLTAGELNSLQTTYTNCVNAVLDGDTFTGTINIHSGGDLNMYSDTGTTLKFSIDGATGSFGIPATQKFYLDGTALTGDSYITEASANNIWTYTNGSASFGTSPSGAGIATTAKLFLDGVAMTGDTYITESAANVVDFYAGGANYFTYNNAVAAVFFPTHTTTASAANVYIDSATGELSRSTSSRKYKQDIVDLDVDSSQIYNLRPVTYYDKKESEKDGTEVDGKIFKRRKYFGLIAEEVKEVFPEMIDINSVTNEPENVFYDRLSVLLLAELKKLKAENDDIKARLKKAGL